jgi:hypothetical protein
MLGIVAGQLFASTPETGGKATKGGCRRPELNLATADDEKWGNPAPSIRLQQAPLVTANAVLRAVPCAGEEVSLTSRLNSFGESKSWTVREGPALSSEDPRADG